MSDTPNSEPSNPPSHHHDEPALHHDITDSASGSGSGSDDSNDNGIVTAVSEPLMDSDLEDEWEITPENPSGPRKRLPGISSVVAAGKSRVRKVLTGDANKSVRAAVKQTVSNRSNAIRSRVRKAFTGTDRRRIRDMVVSELRKPVHVKLVDKLSFTLGVVNLLITEAVVFMAPHLFHLWYLLLFLPLMALRYWIYHKKKHHYFMLDWCYANNVIALVYILWFYDSPQFFQTLFWLSNGPLALAVIVWGNSLVFHSLDKLTSIAIHVLPTLLTFCHRWFVPRTQSLCVHEDCSVAFTDIWQPMAMYVLWQVGYVLKTDIIDKGKFAKDLQLQTSTRWITRSRSGFLYWGCLRLMRRLGVMGPKEHFNGEEFKTKFIFMGAQLVYTLVTLLHVPLLHRYFVLHLLYLATVFIMATWNGAGYYIEVFSKRYLQQLGTRFKFEVSGPKLRPSIEEDEEPATGAAGAKQGSDAAAGGSGRSPARVSSMSFDSASSEQFPEDEEGSEGGDRGEGHRQRRRGSSGGSSISSDGMSSFRHALGEALEEAATHVDEVYSEDYLDDPRDERTASDASDAAME